MSSFGQKFKGKLVWGTSVFRILIETDHSKLKSNFSGTLTLFERRHERESYKFETLAEFISVTRELWKESLRSDSVQDTRLSRWLEELFSEKNISANYQEILDAIRGDFEEVPPLEVGDTEKLSADKIEEILPSTDEYMASGTIQQIKGDFDNKEELDKTLTSFLEEHRPQRESQALSSATFTTADGEIRTLEDRKEIEPEPLDDDVKLVSGFVNDFGMEVSDISFTDTIPFDYKINDISVTGVEATKVAENVKPDGLEVEWHVDKIPAGQNSTIEYKMGKRMLRTILIRDDFNLTILQTYENINKDENTAWVESTYIFQEATPIVENVKILDQLPGDYSMVDSTPEAVPPLATVNTTKESTEITWSYTDVPASTQFVLTYELASSPKILRDRAQVFGKNDELLLEAARILRPEKSGTGFGVIFAVQLHQDFSGMITLKETVPTELQVKQTRVNVGTVAELDQGESKSIIWKVSQLPKGEITDIILHYSLEKNFRFDGFSVELDEMQLITEEVTDNLKKDEKVVLPTDIYQS